ncbi:hypothetical protein VPH35_071885 [Triticum aestivum]
MHATFIPSDRPLGLSPETILMELVELSTTCLAEAMFEKLGLPKLIYHVHWLQQGGCKAEIEFHCTKERFHASACWAKLKTHVCEDEETSMNLAADLAIEYMENKEKKVLVDYNYYQLEQNKKTCARVSDKLLEKSEEINQRSNKIKQITKEACNYVDEVRVASNKIHGLTGVALDPTNSMSVSNLRQALLEIHDAVIALQNTTTTTSQFLEEEGMYSDEDVADPVYTGHSNEDSAEDCHPDMNDDYAHYMRSP